MALYLNLINSAMRNNKLINSDILNLLAWAFTGCQELYNSKTYNLGQGVLKESALIGQAQIYDTNTLN